MTGASNLLLFNQLRVVTVQLWSPRLFAGRGSCCRCRRASARAVLGDDWELGVGLAGDTCKGSNCEQGKKAGTK